MIINEKQQKIAAAALLNTTTVDVARNFIIV